MIRWRLRTWEIPNFARPQEFEQVRNRSEAEENKIISDSVYGGHAWQNLYLFNQAYTYSGYENRGTLAELGTFFTPLTFNVEH